MPISAFLWLPLPGSASLCLLLPISAFVCISLPSLTFSAYLCLSLPISTHLCPSSTFLYPSLPSFCLSMPFLCLSLTCSAHICLSLPTSSYFCLWELRKLGPPLAISASATDLGPSLPICACLWQDLPIWLSLLISAHLPLSLSMGAQKVDRRLQWNGRLGSKV